MKKLACELTDEEREVFVKAYYEEIPEDCDDSIEESPNPWGQPWDYREEEVLSGENIEEMAKNFAIKYTPIIRSAISREEQDFRDNKEKYGSFFSCGKEFAITRQPYVDDEDGESGFRATAENKRGDEYDIFWTCDEEIYEDGEGSSVDWNNPTYVFPL